MSNKISIRFAQRSAAPRLANLLGRAIAAAVAGLAWWMNVRVEASAESAARLRSLAMEQSSQPSFPAELRAAANRQLQAQGMQ